MALVSSACQGRLTLRRMTTPSKSSSFMEASFIAQETTLRASWVEELKERMQCLKVALLVSSFKWWVACYQFWSPRSQLLVLFVASPLALALRLAHSLTSSIAPRRPSSAHPSWSLVSRLRVAALWLLFSSSDRGVLLRSSCSTSQWPLRKPHTVASSTASSLISTTKTFGQTSPRFLPSRSCWRRMRALSSTARSWWMLLVTMHVWSRRSIARHRHSSTPGWMKISRPSSWSLCRRSPPKAKSRDLSFDAWHQSN